MYTCKGCLETFETETLINVRGLALCGDCAISDYHEISVTVKAIARSKRSARALKRMRRIDHIVALTAGNRRIDA